MKKILILGSILLVLVAAAIGFTSPLFAHNSSESEITPTDGKAWEAMHEACWNGDWEAMAEAAEESHGEGWHNHMSGGTWDNGWHGMGGHMNGGMMGW